MSSDSLAEKALTFLYQQSEKAHELVRKRILEEEMGLRKPDKAIEQYLSKWNDTTRPGILAIAHGAVGGKLEKVVPLQGALLFIDATMDIHDDIIDGSVAKENLKTIYGKLGKESALLIGDIFMIRGFFYLHKAIEDIPLGRQSLIMDEVKSFSAEVVYAHISEAQLKSRKWTVKPETYLQVLHKKAAEFEGRMKIGAIYGGGSKKETSTLGKVGRNLGLLLTVRSEYIDIFEPNELSNRVKNECLPLQVLYALRKREYRNEIQTLLSKERLDKSDASELLQLIQKTKAVTPFMEYLRKLKKESIYALRYLKESQEKRWLKILIESTLEDM